MKDLGVFHLEDGNAMDKMYISITNGCAIPLFYYDPASDHEPDAHLSIKHKGTFLNGDCQVMYDRIIEETLNHLLETNILQRNNGNWTWA